MTPSNSSSAQHLLQNVENDSQRINLLEHLLEGLKRESLSLVLQSELTCELLGARIEELEEQVQELSQQQEQFNERLDYYYKKYTDSEERCKRDRKDKIFYIRVLKELLDDREAHIDKLIRKIREVAKERDPHSAAKQKAEESNPYPVPFWLRHNEPQDWYGIALRASRSFDVASQNSDGIYVIAPHTPIPLI